MIVIAVTVIFGTVDKCPFERFDIFRVLRSGLESLEEARLLIVAFVVVELNTPTLFVMYQVDTLVELLGKALLVKP